jgi:D-glycero-alpha-D-manno-heptose 1-phosphate guanylyltransferase
MCSEAIILAGGRGTRLKTVVADKPKPMADINGKPFLEHLIIFLSKNGIKHIILSVGFKAETIINHFGEKFNNIKISYAVEQEPIGTGGGILNALKKAETNNVFIVNGDSIFTIDLQRLAHFHLTKKAVFSVALKKVADGSRYGSVVIDPNNTILAFREKRNEAENVLVNAGIYLISKKSFLRFDFAEHFSFEKDFMEIYYKTEKFIGVEFDGYFIDIGLPESYEQAKSDFRYESFPE